ncbi:hypothetical protein NQZ68_014933 [Dissostichus eleginoides]|nr:hypothetical protein NQZ68_014933 [Dissostichus eleginoides]
MVTKFVCAILEHPAPSQPPLAPLHPSDTQRLLRASARVPILTVREERAMLTTIFHSCDPIMLCRHGKGRDGGEKKEEGTFERRTEKEDF